MDAPRFPAKLESAEPTLRLAVLIDADNAQALIIENLLREIASLGEATVKRIYGDFTSTQSASWKEVLQAFAIKPVQQFAYSKGKNATDSSLIIDAMDLLYSGSFDGFCLVTSDSDFTGLAVRLKEAGLKVYGFGEEKTPKAFRSACHKFTLTEILRPANKAKDESAPSAKTEPTPVKVATKSDVPIDFLLTALEQVAGEDGWVSLSEFGSYLNKIKSDFDPRSYGYKKLSHLVRANKEFFDCEERPVADSKEKIIYLRPAKLE
ncbi:MAG: NYN domain-containing protein [Deltaproteobacteria bacterium]|jgi:uncharacterized LabA/DUF88 family protein|nr:NYN domain-containing protein [Deltaproteobacteria bacterium]